MAGGVITNVGTIEGSDMGYKLSKIRALKICVEMWDLLAAHPKYDKDDVMPLLDLGESTRTLVEKYSCCAACAYTDQFKGTSCNRCPVWAEKDEYGTTITCTSPGSPYITWLTSNSSKTRAIAAKEVADLARAQLEKHLKRYPRRK